MPILKDIRAVVKITFPSIEGSEVEVYDSMLVGDTFDLTSDKGPLYIWTKLIKSWNLTNEAGEILPITVENIKLLPSEALSALLDTQKTNKEEVKKD